MNRNPAMKQRGLFLRKFKNHAVIVISALSTLIAAFFLIWILWTIFRNGMESLSPDFLTEPTKPYGVPGGGMLNAIGLQGPGIDKFLHDEHYLPWLKAHNCTTIVNIWGKSVDDYRYVAERLEAEPDGIAALEINVSCPNVKEGGISFSSDTGAMGRVIAAVRSATKLPLITKLSPNVKSMPEFARAAADHGSDIVSMINTIPAMSRWFMKPRGRWIFRSSAWAVSSPGKMRWNSCLPELPRSRSARRFLPTRWLP